MTWSEFKKIVEDCGVREDMKIDMIDLSGWDESSITVRISENLVTIWA